MYIKCIVLDGFKSYAQRTEIQGFDPQFNAITGLNGSGKSNILDSICFVLGITNLTHVRAASLQDLIYKSGQTGVSKATVSITFNNAAKAQAPPGLEQCDEITITRQIMLGGKNKYLINGTIVPNKRIQDVFCSVHLNVNNPHFLVMQGKITKVLNMKPQEILGMIEEAAGTKMYEMKRQVHLKTMERKNTKLKEFQEVFANDIEPRLQKLREQRAQYFEFQRVERDVERLTQICVAWTFYNSERVANVRERDVIAVENKIEELTLAIRENSEAAKLIEREVKDKMEECKLASGGKVEEIEAELRQKQKAAAEAGAAEKAAKESVENEERNIKQLRKALQADEAVLAKKEHELSDVRSVFEALKADEEADGEALVACQKKYEAICAGMEVTESGQAQTLREQLISVSERAKETNTNLEVYNLNLAKCRGELEAKRGGLAGASDNYNRDRSALDGIEREAGAVEASLGQLGYSGDRMAELQRRRHALQAAVSDHQDNTENFYASRPHVRFRYADPEPGFDRSSVCGVVATLIKLKDRAYSTAIEMAAGAKLYCVIVDKDTTSKKLLERGNLQNRTTFVPLNQIRSERMTPEVVDFARKLVGKENLVPALDVLEYSPHLQPAMEYVFGNVFLAKDLATAKRVSYHASVKKRCVTLEGDVTDPSGVLSGGARQKATPILMLLKDVQREEEEAKSKQKELALLQSELNSMSAAQEKYSNLKNRLDLLRHQSQILKDRLQQDSFCKQQEEVKQLEATVAELEKNIEEARGVQSDCDSKIREIEAKMTDSKDHLERRQREIEAELAGLQKRAERSREKWVQREGEHRTLNIEMDELRGAVAATEEGIRSAEEAIRAVQERHAELQAESDRLKGAVAELRARMQAEEAAIAAKNKEIQQIAAVRDRKVQENMKIELEVKRLQHNLTNTQNEYKIAKSELNRCSKDVKSVAEKYLKEAQGLSDGDGHKMQRKLSDGKAKMAELKTKVNPKAQKMYEHEEKEFEQMRKKVEMILKDKEKLIQTIESLDRQKKEAITIAFDRVTEDIGSILGTLLPDAGAKLVIPKGHTILTGVEIKVSLGGVWKDSLGELSGGQRSLVALSLILAMLRFNPAPLYILDEVDAALDLSHTQNIGVMLKQHFKQSQFIIVSLKDGMFNNANVLFKTQFIDGMSTIMRTTNQR